MFHKKHDKLEISQTSSQEVFSARYLGQDETFLSSGRQAVRHVVQRLWDNSPNVRRLRKVRVNISLQELSLDDITEGEKSGWRRVHPLHMITYCTVDREHHNIFAWVYRNQSTRKFECHAVWSRHVDRSQAMALTLSRTFQAAFKDWQLKRRRDARIAELAAAATPAHTTAASSEEDLEELSSEVSRSLRLLDDSISGGSSSSGCCSCSSDGCSAVEEHEVQVPGKDITAVNGGPLNTSGMVT